jgi:hypothetical protein
MSRSLEILKERFNKAKPFKFDISMTGIQLTEDVKEFIRINHLKFDNAKTRFIFIDEIGNIHLSIEKLIKEAFIIRKYAGYLKYDGKKAVTCPKVAVDKYIKDVIKDYNNKSCGAFFQDIGKIVIHLPNLSESAMFNEMDLQKRIAQTISHEVMHQVLIEHSNKANEDFDNIAFSLRCDGYGV